MATPQEVYDKLTAIVDDAYEKPLQKEWQVMHDNPLVVARWYAPDCIEFLVSRYNTTWRYFISEGGFPHEVRRFMLESEQR